MRALSLPPSTVRKYLDDFGVAQNRFMGILRVLLVLKGHLILRKNDDL